MFQSRPASGSRFRTSRNLFCAFFCLPIYAQQPDAEKVPARKDTIVVTGVVAPLPLAESDRALEVLPAREHPLLFNTFSDLLNLDSSLDLRERAPGMVQSGLSIRGGSFGQTLVLLNGMRLNNVQSSNHNMDVPVPLEAVSHIEALSGSGSSLYGSDAVAGVVNFVTAPPQATEMKLGAGVGNFGVNQQNASVAWTSKVFDQQLSFSRDFSSGFVQNRDYRNLSIASDSNVRTKLGLSHITLALNDRPFGAEHFYGNFNSWERTKGWFAGIHQPLGENTDVSFSYRRHSDLFVLYRDRPQVFTNRHVDESYQASVRRRDHPSRNVTIFYGAEMLHDEIDSNNLGTHQRTREAVYGGVELRALGRFSFTVSAREELYRNLRQQFSPSISGGVWLTSAWKLRASVSRAFRLPTFTDLYYHDPANLGNPLLQPETAWAFEGGADYRPTARLHFDATYFQRREKNGIDFVRTSPTEIWRATNFQALTFNGFEGGGRMTMARRQTLDLHYTFLDGAQNVLGAQQSKYVFNYARHSGLIGWSAVVGQVAMRARLGVVERFARDPYGVLDVAISRTSGALRPFLRVSNLTDTNYQEFFGVPLPGRSAVVGMEWVVFSRR